MEAGSVMVMKVFLWPCYQEFRTNVGAAETGHATPLTLS